MTHGKAGRMLIPRRTALVAAGCIASFMVLPAGAQSTGTARPSPDFKAIDSYVIHAMAADNVPGVAIAIVRGDSVVHVKGFGGDGRGNAVTGETGFVLGSMSKAFTALAMMQLVERGKVDLDAPVQRYLPWFRVGDPAASAAISVRQLLLHTSGIPTRAPRARGNDRTLTDHVRALAGVSLNNAPGTKHEYSSPNFIVAGAIIEAVTGLPFARYVDGEILDPLAMRHSFTDAARTGEGLSRGHVYRFGFPVATDLPHEHDRLPTAGMIASAGDLGHFLVAQLNHGRFGDQQVLGDSAMTVMHTGGVESDGFSYAFGWRESLVAGSRAVHHGGIVPNFRGKMVMLPDLGWGVVVLTNVSSAIPFPIAPTSHRMADAIAAHLAGEPLPDAGSRHAATFALLTAAMLVVIVAQGRGLWRIWRGKNGVHSRAAAMRASVGDVIVVAAIAFFAPRFAGASWPEFVAIAPDVAWWLVAVAMLSILTVVARLRLRRNDGARGGPM